MARKERSILTGRPTLRLLSLALALLPALARAEGPTGYYRQPAIHGDAVVFVAEGDLWRVPASGGVARRLTSHPAEESQPAVSPDGRTLAFVGRYEGPAELYTMPFDGGLPVRRTWGSGRVALSGFHPDGRVIYATRRYATLPDDQLVLLDPTGPERSGPEERVPLSQAADGTYDETGTLFFTRLPAQGSHTKRYRGGTAQTIWKYAPGAAEAVPLTADYRGTSKRPMFWRGRVYFLSDRDGTMNLWSMDRDGRGLAQHTHHSGWDAASPDLHEGRVVYQLGADLRLYDVASGSDRPIPITLDTDLDQTREHWIREPMDYLSAVQLSPDGERVALTARGRVFVAPRKQGRLVEAARDEGVRYRRARFLPGTGELTALSDRSGEVELWTLPANGVGEGRQLTRDGRVLRWDAVPSPDGKRIAHHDKNQRLFMYDVAAGTNRRIDESTVGDFSDLAWSPDGRTLAYVIPASNLFARIKLHDAETGESAFVTSDRFDSYAPVFSPDGKWLYFLSDRDLVSSVRHPWGSYQPEPHLDRTTRVYLAALQSGLRSPFAPRDELHADEEKKDDEKKDEKKDEKTDDKQDKKKGAKKEEEKKVVPVELEGIAERIQAVPLPRGRYAALSVSEDALYWLARSPDDEEDGATLHGVKIARDDLEAKTVAEKVLYYDLSADGKRLLLRKKKDLYVVDAKPDRADLDKAGIDLSGWALSVVPREEWRQMFVESWRLERDYFYDPGMHGVDWQAMLDKYLPLVDRVTTREELSDLMGQMVSELSALHIFVYGGDRREGPDDVEPASLGARLAPDEKRGGYRVEHVYRSDPDRPTEAPPLSRPEVGVREGDVIESINGEALLSAPDPAALLRGQAGRQVLLRVRPAKEGEARDVIVRPLSADEDADLRYGEWEYTRRLETERRGEGRLGYVHLRAMGGADFTRWAEGFYPVFDREGLIVDVRHNRGGNIDSWILGRLMRKAWAAWSQRVGRSPSWNMQYAFRGHVVVLCDEWTASDGEAFSEGFRRLGLGPVIGTRTWGGEIWLTSSNRLVDKGIATAAEFGVYGPEGEWLIEGHGVDPDIVVDNLPHATFEGRDAQLERGIEWLLRKLEEEPVEPLVAPGYPVKAGG